MEEKSTFSVKGAITTRILARVVGNLYLMELKFAQIAVWRRKGMASKSKPGGETESYDPEMTFHAIFRDLARHAKSHPTHGYNCSCMESLIVKVTNMTRVPNRDQHTQRQVDRMLRMAIQSRGS